jgi:hypothetical protein
LVELVLGLVDSLDGLREFRIGGARLGEGPPSERSTCSTCSSTWRSTVEAQMCARAGQRPEA